MIEEAFRTGWRREARMAALSLLGGHFLRSLGGRDRCEQEFLAFLDHRFCLRDDQRAWCRELIAYWDTLPDGGNGIEKVLASAEGVLGSLDLELLRGLFVWFSEMEEPSGQRVSGTALFPDSVAEAFTVFDLPVTLDAGSIKKAFRRKVAAFHPDRAESEQNGFQNQLHERLTRTLIAARGEILSFYRSLSDLES
jgi:hypothetical protein